MPEAIYLNASSASNIDTGKNYYMRIYGTFGDNPTAQYQLAPTDWLGGAFDLDNWIMLKANQMEDWYTDYYNRVVTLTGVYGAVRALNETGGVAFIIGVSDLELKRPHLFGELKASIIHIDKMFKDNFGDYSSWQDMVGGDLTKISEDIGNIFNWNGRTFIGLALIVFYMLVAGFAVQRGQVTVGLALAFPFVILAGFLRVIDIALVLVICAVAVLLTVITFYFQRM
jgi:hypothetical protein